MGAILTVDNINVYYGSIHAIKGISFEVNAGEIVTLIGANGAGKSTTLNTISGLLRSRTGSIHFNGEDLGKLPPHKTLSKGLALVPEGRRIFLQMTVQENLDMGAYIRKNNIKPELDMVYDYFPRLKERSKQVAGTLSGGEQQMLAMGRALMSKPKVIMLDEPSMGLAPILVEEIFEIIKHLHEAGTTILLVEQNAQAALSVADRGYVMETGKIVASGTGRGQDNMALLLRLRATYRFDAPLCSSSGLLQALAETIAAFPDWVRPDVADLLPLLPAFDEYNQQAPAVVVTTPASLTHGHSADVFAALAPDRNNVVVVPENVRAVPAAKAAVVRTADFNHADGFSFGALADALRPAAVVLVHGEASAIERARRHFEKTLRVPVHAPPVAARLSFPLN